MGACISSLNACSEQATNPSPGMQAELPLMKNARSNIKTAMQEGATVTLGQSCTNLYKESSRPCPLYGFVVHIHYHKHPVATHAPNFTRSVGLDLALRAVKQA